MGICLSRMLITDWALQVPNLLLLMKLAVISPVVRYRSPTPPAQSQGAWSPHSQRLKTMGLPVALSAALMVLYASGVLRLSVLHQSYFRKSTPQDAYNLASSYSCPLVPG